MNINQDFTNEEEIPSPSEVMDAGMDFIYENLIEPMEAQLSEEQLKIVAIIGAAFRAVANQAEAMDYLEKSMKNFDNQDNSRN